jgi:hypothetical protein
MVVEHPTNFVEREVRQLDRLLPWTALWVAEQLNLRVCQLWRNETRIREGQYLCCADDGLTAGDGFNLIASISLTCITRLVGGSLDQEVAIVTRVAIKP